MKVLITGGAGYVGSTVASACIDNGIEPVILDDLSYGRLEYVADRTFYRGDICDGKLVDQIFSDHPEIFAVVHSAALIQVAESVDDPLLYYHANTGKTITFLGHVMRNRCNRLILSSTAAIYEAGSDFVVDEGSAIEPKSPYAHSKSMIETILQDIVRSSELRVISFRYFNLVGADPFMRTGLQHRHPSHLLGKLIAAAEENGTFLITGVRWPTRDGTGVRDFVHIWDLARAHVAGIRKFDEIVQSRRMSYAAINLGTGRGTTVREMLTAFEKVVGHKINVSEVGPRPGDIAGAYTRTGRARALLGWQAQQTLEDGIRHSLEWAAYRKKLFAE